MQPLDGVKKEEQEEVKYPPDFEPTVVIDQPGSVAVPPAKHPSSAVQLALVQAQKTTEPSAGSNTGQPAFPEWFVPVDPAPNQAASNSTISKVELAAAADNTADQPGDLPDLPEQTAEVDQNTTAGGQDVPMADSVTESTVGTTKDPLEADATRHKR